MSVSCHYDLLLSEGDPVRVLEALRRTALINGLQASPVRYCEGERCDFEWRERNESDFAGLERWALIQARRILILPALPNQKADGYIASFRPLDLHWTALSAGDGLAVFGLGRYPEEIDVPNLGRLVTDCQGAAWYWHAFADCRTGQFHEHLLQVFKTADGLGVLDRVEDECGAWPQLQFTQKLGLGIGPEPELT